MNTYFNKLLDRLSIKPFMNGGYHDYYKLLYGTPQYPFWFICQSLFSCYVAHKNVENKKKTPLIYSQQLFTAFFMTFASRELFAYFFDKLSPIKHNPQTIIIFLGIFVMMCIHPIYKIINYFESLVGIVQGVNMSRFFTLALRNIKGIPVELVLPTAIIFSVMDQLIELIIRKLFKYQESKISTNFTILRAGVFCTIFWLFTHKNFFSKYIGIHSIYFPALLLALVLSASNSTRSFFSQNQDNDEFEENQRLRLLINQILHKAKEDRDNFTNEINNLKRALSETEQKAKEDHDRLTAEIEHLKKD